MKTSVMGYQVLGGTAATAIGAAGGAVAGINLERNHRSGASGYRVTVRLDNGRRGTFSPSQIGGLRVGDRVRFALSDCSGTTNRGVHGKR